jgi:hypothetical protein
MQRLLSLRVHRLSSLSTLASLGFAMACSQSGSTADDGPGAGPDASVGGSAVQTGGAAAANAGGVTGLNTGGSEIANAGGLGQGAIDGAGGLVSVGGGDLGSGGGLTESGGSLGSGGADVGVEPGADPLLGDVGFTVPSQAFEGQLQVGLVGEGEIRYTTDGTEPTAASPLWDVASLTLTETTQLRAAVFSGGIVQGRPSAALYILRNFDVSADVPIIIMDGYGLGKPPVDNKVDWRDLGLMMFEPEVEGGTTSMSVLPSLAARAGYHVRGQSSANFSKTPYRVELWGVTDEDEDQVVLGMPEESDWAFVGPCTDSTLVRNAFVYSLSAEMNLTSMQLRFAEVYINQDGGPLEESDYEGVYTIVESIKNQKSRLNLQQLQEDDVELPAISGGYIFKFDQRAVAVDDGEVQLRCRGADGEVITDGSEGCWEDMELVDPAPANAQQTAYIEGHIQQLHDLLHAQPLGDYQSMIDVPSFVDHYIINEMTSNVDAYIRSHYMHKDREGLVKSGPIWDYNFALGNVGTALTGFTYDNVRAMNGTNDWHLIIGPDPTFHEQMQARYRELRASGGILSDAQLFARLDGITAPLLNAATHNLQRWAVGQCSIGGGGFPGGDPPEDGEFVLGDAAEAAAAWQSELVNMKDWIAQRMAWLDDQWL